MKTTLTSLSWSFAERGSILHVESGEWMNDQRSQSCSNPINMDSREGQLYDLQGGYYTSEMAAEGSTLESMGMPETMKRRGLFRSSSGLSQFFWASEEDEMESAPRDMKHKWKKMMQRRSTDESSETDEAEHTVDSTESKWQDLPMELLVRILALVENRTVVVASGVCTGWRDSICLGITELSFSWCGRSVSKLVQSVAPKFARLESCTIRRCACLNDQAIEAVGAKWHDLRALDLTYGACITDSSLIALANGCPLLEKLDLSGCVGISEAGLVVLAQHCKNLQYLNLCGCDNAGSDAALLALAQNCSGLQLLNVGWCEQITDVGVTALAHGCPDLRVVDFCGCHLITDQSVVVLSDKCLYLRFLGLYRCRNITDLAMYSLVNNSKRRNSVKSNKCNSSTSSNSRGRGESARSFRPSGSSFTYSSVGSCSSRSGSSCSSTSDASNPPTFSKGGFDTFLGDPAVGGLMSLNLGGCTGLSAQAVQAVCNAFPELHTCPERHSLIISGCLNLTSVHCICVIEARRERVNRAAYAARQAYNPLHRPL